MRRGLRRLAQTSLGTELRLDSDLAGGEGKVSGSTRAPRYADAAADALRLSGKASFHGGELNPGYELTGEGLKHPQAQFARFTANGSLRAGKGFARLRLESEFAGRDFHPGAGFDNALASAAENARGTMAGAVLEKLRAALLREAHGSTLRGRASVRKTGARSA